MPQCWCGFVPHLDLDVAKVWKVFWMCKREA